MPRYCCFTGEVDEADTEAIAVVAEFKDRLTFMPPGKSL
jgi:hypothetical protein